MGVALFLSSVPACGNGEAAVRGARGRVVDSSAGTVALGLSEADYRAVPLAAAGRIAGTITLPGDSASAAADSIVPVTRDPRVCGDSASVVEVRANGSALANALIWLQAPPQGKPLPLVRRERIAIEKCRFEPRVLAVASGTTINVFSADRTEHDASFYREAGGEPVERVRTFGPGSVVPSEKIAAAAGVVEARSPLRPWQRAFVAVFNHPYFAVSDDAGGFTIDSVPPGDYVAKVWHERLASPIEQRVRVSANGTARLDVALPLR